MRKRSIIYRTARGSEPYAEYVDSLKDREGAAKIRMRVTRAEFGNLGIWEIIEAWAVESSN